MISQYFRDSGSRFVPQMDNGLFHSVPRGSKSSVAASVSPVRIDKACLRAATIRKRNNRVTLAAGFCENFSRRRGIPSAET
jgi:hypothetical protein